jgi:Ca-activated chloride channel family protein
MRTLAVIASITWAGLWLTADQRGARHFERGEFEMAAESFDDPMWQGAAWYRAGAFEKAVQAYARRDTAESDFNTGNAWLLRGKYEDAIAAYDRALKRRPEWAEARENRDLAAARAKGVERTGGDMGDQQIGADDVVFDKTKKPEAGQDTVVAGEQAVSDASVQAMWLRRVQTKPADFLKAKFAYQLATEVQEAK